MANEREHGNLFDDDDLDDAVISADDTGMVNQQHLIAKEEILAGEEGLEDDEEKPPA